MSVLKTSTYPKGPHWKLSKDDIVQVLQPNGRLKDCYVGALCSGDEYLIPSPQDVPRTAAMLLEWLQDNNIEVDYTFDLDGAKAIELSRENDRFPLVTYPCGKGSLVEAINFCIDQEEDR